MGGRVGDHETGQFIFVFLDLQGEQSYREKKKKKTNGAWDKEFDHSVVKG